MAKKLKKKNCFPRQRKQKLYIHVYVSVYWSFIFWCFPIKIIFERIFKGIVAMRGTEMRFKTLIFTSWDSFDDLIFSMISKSILNLTILFYSLLFLTTFKLNGIRCTIKRQQNLLFPNCIIKHYIIIYNSFTYIVVLCNHKTSPYH